MAYFIATQPFSSFLAHGMLYALATCGSPVSGRRCTAQ
ncbi:hypothetical protein D083_1214 [Dickeya solani RNS 08.23.3.1.A]|nr:hypothetical protein D083_1214 [Dickeya solani RNS 08.23.3.1.A]